MLKDSIKLQYPAELNGSNNRVVIHNTGLLKNKSKNKKIRNNN